MVVLSTSPNSEVTKDLECAGIQLNNHRQKFRQRFDVIRKLGQGTYGKVQLALKKETGEQVAIKTIKKAKIQTKEDLTRIQREIQLMSLVQHPHIIHIYEVFENKEKIVLVMEYAAGGELYEYLSSEKNLSESEARRIFRQVVAAVYYCHKNNICHRDLKLENILLDENKNAKIADFGLSNVFDQKKLLETFCGSPLYASPEIVKGKPYCGPEVDCWSLGVLLYTLVYGAMPFDGSNFQKLVKQISEGDYYEPKNRAGASELIHRLLTVSADHRATIENVCKDSWVNAECNDSLLLIAENVGKETPVRLDYLLQLVPSEVPQAVQETESKDNDTENENPSNPIVIDLLNRKHQLSASESSISDKRKKNKTGNVEISEVADDVEAEECSNQQDIAPEEQSAQQKSTTVAFMNDPKANMCTAELAFNKSDHSETSSEDNTPEVDVKNSKIFNPKHSESTADYDSLSLNVLTTSSEQSLDTLTGAEVDDMTWGSAASIAAENVEKPENEPKKQENLADNAENVDEAVISKENAEESTTQVDKNATTEKAVNENTEDEKPRAIRTEDLDKNVSRFSSYEKEYSNNGPGEEYFREVKKDTEEVSHRGYSMHRSHVCTFEKSVIKEGNASETRKKSSLTRSDSKGSTGSNDDLEDMFETIAGENSWLCDMLARTKAIIEEFSLRHKKSSLFKEPLLCAEDIFAKYANTSFSTATSGIGSSRSSNTSSQRRIDEDALKDTSRGSWRSAHSNLEFKPSFTSKMTWDDEKMFKTRSSSMPTEEMSNYRSYSRSVSEEDKQHSKTLINEESKSSSHFSSLKKNSSLSSQSSVSSKYRCEDSHDAEMVPKWGKAYTSQRSTEDYENKSAKHTSVKKESKHSNEEASSTCLRRDFAYPGGKDECLDFQKPKSVFSYTKSRTHELLQDRQDEDNFDTSVRRPRSLSLLCGDDGDWDFLSKQLHNKQERDGATGRRSCQDEEFEDSQFARRRFEREKEAAEKDMSSRLRFETERTSDAGKIEREIKEMTDDLSNLGGLRSRLRERDTELERDLFKANSRFGGRSQDFTADFELDNDLEESVSDRIKRKSFLVRQQDLGTKSRHGTDTNFSRLMSRSRLPADYDRLAHHSFSSRNDQMFEGRSNVNSRHERFSSSRTTGLDEEGGKNVLRKKPFSFNDN